MRRFVDPVRQELGGRFDAEAGRRLTSAEAVELAFATFDSDRPTSHDLTLQRPAGSVIV